MFEETPGSPRLLTTTFSRVATTFFAVPSLDLLLAPTMGYIRDHFINPHLPFGPLKDHSDFFLLPLLLAVHLAATIGIAWAVCLRNPDNPTAHHSVWWTSLVCLPGVVVAYLFDELLYWQFVF